MKTKSLIVLSLIILLTTLCGSSKKQKIPFIIDFNKRFVKVDDNFYADKYEVTVKDYQLFLKERQEKGLDNSLVIYDSTLWGKHWGGPFTALGDYYFNHDASADHPIVCITHSAAIEFCNWLTDKYNTNPQKKHKKVLFRLPTEREFVKVAISIYDSTKIFFPWGNNTLYDAKKEKLCNFTELDQKEMMLADNNKLQYAKSFPANYVESVGYYKANPYGIFDIVGNASEMIQTDGIAMGGNWLSLGYHVRVTSQKKYTKSDITVGFRVYMEIIEL